MAVRANIIDTGAGLKAPSFKEYDVDAKGLADENAWRYESLKRYDN